MCSPVTGRTHQIREHLGGRGFPIIGETESLSKMSVGYSEKRVDTGVSVWNYKLDLFEKFGINSPQVIQQALQDSIYEANHTILDDLCLFSFRYQVGPFNFISELFTPDWVPNNLRKDILYLAKHAVKENKRKR